jgi:hypothetical protein
MRAIIDGQTGVVLALGGASLVAAAGQEAVENDALTLDALAALTTAGQEVWWDRAAGRLRARVHVVTAAELAAAASNAVLSAARVMALEDRATALETKLAAANAALASQGAQLAALAARITALETLNGKKAK